MGILSEIVFQSFEEEEASDEALFFDIREAAVRAERDDLAVSHLVYDDGPNSERVWSFKDGSLIRLGDHADTVAYASVVASDGTTLASACLI